MVFWMDISRSAASNTSTDRPDWPALLYGSGNRHSIQLSYGRMLLGD